MIISICLKYTKPFVILYLQALKREQKSNKRNEKSLNKKEMKESLSMIRTGEIVSIYHYSFLNSIKSRTIAVVENIISVMLVRDFAEMNFFEGDPVVLVAELDNEVHVIGCNVLSINLKEHILEVSIDGINSSSNRRQYERFPVSLHADVITKNPREKSIGYVKDISKYGLLIYSKEELSISQEIEINLYIEKMVVFLKGRIVRRTDNKSYNEYGILLIYDNLKSLNRVWDYIGKLNSTYEEVLRKFKSNL